MYSCYVISVLQYCASVWSPHTIGAKVDVENIQRNFTRNLGLNSLLGYLDRISFIGIHTLALRRLINDLVLMYKVLNGLVDVEDPGSFVMLSKSVTSDRQRQQTRGHAQKIIKPAFKSNLRKNFWSVRLIDCWNKLSPSTISSSSGRTFKKSLETVELTKLQTAVGIGFYNKF